MIIAIRSVVFATTKAMGTLGLGGVILWQVAAHSGPQTGAACVHVSAPNTEVIVDGLAHHVETLWNSPIVVELRPGRHKLSVFHEGQVIDEREFTLGVGEEIVLVAGDRPTETQLSAQQMEPTPSELALPVARLATFRPRNRRFTTSDATGWRGP
jgi:hypothetical protein